MHISVHSEYVEEGMEFYSETLLYSVSAVCRVGAGLRESSTLVLL